jgi:hypothetical protein
MFRATVPTYTLHEGPEKDPQDAIVTDDGVNTWTTEAQKSEKKFLEGLKIWADVGVKLGSSIDRQEHMRRAAAREEALQRNTPAMLSLTAAGICPASGPLVLAVGGPDIGTYFEVEAWTVGGNDINIASAGIAGLYISEMTTSAGLGTSNLVDNTNKAAGPSASSSMPYSNFYGGQKVVCLGQQNVIVAIYNGTPGQQYVTNVNVTVVNVAASQGSVEFAL